MEEDNEGLIDSSDDNSSSDPESSISSADLQHCNDSRNIVVYSNHTKCDFLITKILLVVSTTVMVILLPLIIEANNNTGSDVYSLISQTTFISSFILVITMYTMKRYCAKFKNTNIFAFPLKWPLLIQLSACYSISTLAIMYALDRKRVVCHVQDPLKASILVFSLIYYFIFCRKLMGLRRIFSATTVVAGLFIAVDYGICNEFRCRGFDRRQWSDEGGPWSKKIHWIWSLVYLVGLALYAFYYSLMERHLFHTNEVDYLSGASTSAPILNTISGSLTRSDNNYMDRLNEDVNQENVLLARKYSVLHLTMWIQVFSLVLFTLLFWTDLVPDIGNTSSFFTFLKHITNGLLIDVPEGHKYGVVPYGWLYVVFYMAFTILSLKFLILSQSAVYTVAVMCLALPLSGIWWGMFKLQPFELGLLIWSPSVTGELVCSLLGLPIVCVGLGFLCKAHFTDYRWSRQSFHSRSISVNNYP